VKRLHIGDRLLRIRDEGEGGKTPVCLIHGAASSSVVWMEAVRRIAPRRRVIALDLPGHGQSDRWHPPPEVSIAMYRDAVGTVCAHLKIPKVILVGHSMGGLIALSAAATWPERVAGLVMVGSGARLRVSPAVHQQIQKDFSHFNEWFARIGWSAATPLEIVERWAGISMTADQEITAADFQAVDRFDGRELPARIKTPTLILGAADDLATPPKLSEELSAIAGARVTILPRAGHWMMLEQPDAFFAELDPFLASIT
jgi:pimeloyl-ACP methyl ester carboxylesterase